LGVDLIPAQRTAASKLLNANLLTASVRHWCALEVLHAHRFMLSIPHYLLDCRLLAECQRASHSGAESSRTTASGMEPSRSRRLHGRILAFGGTDVLLGCEANLRMGGDT